MCKYCEDYEKLSDGHIRVVILGEMLRVECDEFKDDGEPVIRGVNAYIRFCPMCGRKLGDD